ncbi:TRAP transporter small permease [Granulosicoccus antarcticus]|uniref:TRAP transporter small permease protein n=1 Tax=Granulosicoccus antarcticus IMCC3135 TaxID=1192854 RepID=A0A2Z2NP62_9GAMM|nr:TRAP transporter small permease [Granulosicoccus antarcticus]ASJ73039.1 2,3-diketo-L-gulonate TRAP transporter small permease protein YiaM [Granulosicoccus antarcticus IMCC3135]
MVESKSLTVKVLQKLRDVCVLISSISLVVLILTFAWLVFGRYVLNQTPTWVEQLALVLVVWITFLGAGAGVHDDTHLGVSFIREAMPPKIRHVLRITCEVTMAVFGLVMLVACTELVQFGWSTKLPMLNIPEGIRTLPAAIAGGLIFLFATERAVRMIAGGVSPDKPVVPISDDRSA